MVDPIYDEEERFKWLVTDALRSTGYTYRESVSQGMSNTGSALTALQTFFELMGLDADVDDEQTAHMRRTVQVVMDWKFPRPHTGGR